MIILPPSDGEYLIVVRVTPTTGDRYAVAINSTHPDARWTARALQLAAEAGLIEDDGPAITTSGHLVERSTTFSPTPVAPLTGDPVNPVNFPDNNSEWLDR